MQPKLKVGIVGATGMVGQRFVTLLAEHPWFELVSVAASSRSADKPYAEAVAGRWALPTPLPPSVGALPVRDAAEVESVAAAVDCVFSAVEMPKEQIRALEERYARAETPVISNNSAHRWTPDVPMVIPEINGAHLGVLESQRRRLGVKNGFIVVKPNCSIQSYVPALEPLRPFGPQRVIVATYQAISGAGKTFADWPEMVDNVIPFIAGEEEKSEKEPLKVWGRIEAGEIVAAEGPQITSQCIRVPVTDGHLAAVFVGFSERPARELILERWSTWEPRPQQLGLPSAPRPFLTYMGQQDRPQTRLDREAAQGMGVTIGRLREDRLLDYRFVALSHNTLRGAAGGAVLTAELLRAEGYLHAK